MNRRQLLIGATAAVSALAGCSGGGDDGDEPAGGDGKIDDVTVSPTATPSPTPTETAIEDPTVPGSLIASDAFEAVELVGVVHAEDNTLTISGTLENVSGADRIVSGLLMNYHDGDGNKLISTSNQLEEEVTIASGATGDVEVTTGDLGKADASAVASFEVVVNSREA